MSNPKGQKTQKVKPPEPAANESKEKVTVSEPMIAEQPEPVIPEPVIPEPVIPEPVIQRQAAMYVGPSIPNVVQTSTVFKDGVLTEALQQVITNNPFMKKLLIPLNELPSAMKELSDDKSCLGTIYRKVKNENIRR